MGESYSRFDVMHEIRLAAEKIVAAIRESREPAPSPQPDAAGDAPGNEMQIFPMKVPELDPESPDQKWQKVNIELCKLREQLATARAENEDMRNARAELAGRFAASEKELEIVRASLASARATVERMCEASRNVISAWRVFCRPDHPEDFSTNVGTAMFKLGCAHDDALDAIRAAIDGKEAK